MVVGKSPHMKLRDSRNMKPTPQVIVPRTALGEIIEKPVVSIEGGSEGAEMAHAETMEPMPSRSTSSRSPRGGERGQGLVENEDSEERREDLGRPRQFGVGGEGQKLDFENELDILPEDRQEQHFQRLLSEDSSLHPGPYAPQAIPAPRVYVPAAEVISHNFQAKRLPNMNPLTIEGSAAHRTVDTAAWFAKLQNELLGGGIPQSRWVDFLKMNVSEDNREILDNILEELRADGLKLQRGQEIFLRIVDDLAMEQYLLHHHGVHICGWFLQENYLKQDAHTAYRKIKALEKKYNQAVERNHRYGLPGQVLTNDTYAVFYLTALKTSTLQRLRCKVKTLLCSPSPLEALHREATAAEDVSYGVEVNYGRRQQMAPGMVGAITTDFAGRNFQKRNFENLAHPRVEKRPWSERSHEQCHCCGLSGHRLDTCQQWDKMRPLFPIGSCAKCFQKGHHAETCKLERGKMWKQNNSRPYDQPRQTTVVGMVAEPNNFQPRVPESKNSKSYGQNRTRRKRGTRGYKTEISKNYRGPDITPTNLKFCGDTSVSNPNNVPLRYREQPYSKAEMSAGCGAETEITGEERVLGVFPPKTHRKQSRQIINLVEGTQSCVAPNSQVPRGDIHRVMPRRVVSQENHQSETCKDIAKFYQNSYRDQNEDPGDDGEEAYGEFVAMILPERERQETVLNLSERNMEIKLTFGNKIYKAVLDTGCPYTLVKNDTASEWERHGALQVLEPHINQLTDVNGRDLLFHRTVSMRIEPEFANHGFPARGFSVKLGVVEWLPVDVLIGMDLMHKLKLVLTLGTKKENFVRTIITSQLEGARAPLVALHLRRNNYPPVDTLPKVGVGEAQIMAAFTACRRPENLTATCMTVSAWSRTLGRDLKAPQLSRKENLLNLHAKENKAHEEMGKQTHEMLRGAIFHEKPTAWTDEQRGAFFSLCSRYPTIWNSGDAPLSSTTLTKCNLELEENCRPIKMAVRAMSESKKIITRGLIKEMLDEGIIVPSRSTWAAPVVLVPKADGAWRLCIDYRELNKVLKVPSWPLPRMHQVCERLQGVRFACTLDLLQGYYQIALHEESRYLTAFQTTEGLYEYTRLPFGLAPAPAVFQNFVDTLLGVLRPYRVEAYLDDFLLKGETWPGFLQNAADLFEICKEHKIQFKPQKCDMGMKELAFLGFLISTEGVKPIPLKIMPLQKFLTPTTRKQLKSFLGMTGYYRKFVKNYATIAAILHALDSDSMQFKWSEAHQTAFEHLKREICEATMLAHPDYTKTFIVDCDASNIGLGAVLSQIGINEVENPISFASRKLTGAETKWGATELEAFAVVWALEIFRPWIDGCEVLVRTDHSPLLWLQKNVSKTPKLARWVLRLQEFSFRLEHRPGKAQVVADSLSRNPLKRQRNDHFDFDPAEKGMNMFSEIEVGENVCNINGNEEVSAGNGVEGDMLWKDPALIESSESRKMEPFSLKRLLEEIEKCPITIWALQKISEPELESSSWLKRVDGKLEIDAQGRIWVLKITRAQNPSYPKLLLIPTGMISGIIQRVHGGSHGGHFAHRKTLEKLKNKFFWPTMNRDVQRFIRGCALCWSVGRNPEGRLRPKAMLPLGAPGEIIAIDFFGPLAKTRRNNRFILVMIDHFTRWVMVEPLIDAKAYSVVETILHRWIPTQGVPVIMLSDNGPHFRSKITTNLCEKLGVRNIFSTPYHPQGNGIVEAFMRPLKKILSTQVSELGNHWDLCCSAAAFAYNSTPHVTTKRSPFFLMHGFEAMLPVQRELELPAEYRNSDLWIRGLWEARRTVYEDHIQEHKKRHIALQGTGFPVGSFVALRHSCRVRDDEIGKLGSLMSGPWKVVSVTSNGVTHFVKCPQSGAIRQVTTGQMKLVELPIPVLDTNSEEFLDQEKIREILPLAEIDDNINRFEEPERIPVETNIRGRALRNTDARRANASVLKQKRDERLLSI